MTVEVLTIAAFLQRWPAAPGEAAALLTPEMAGVVVAVVDDAGALRGYWPIWYTVHVDGLWLDPALKGEGPGTLRSLLAAVFATLHANGADQVFAVLPPDGPSTDQAARLGFTRAPGDLYLLRVR